MTPVNWGILGPGTIARAFAKGIAESRSSRLTAIGSRSTETLRTFGDDFGVPTSGRYNSYAALCADPLVEAIYVATPHPFHLDHATMVLEAGKHLLLEKPAGLNGDQVRQIAAKAARHDRFWAEGYMYLHHPQIVAALRLLEGLGPVLHVRADFCFDVPFDPASRLYSPALAGGGVLDVGGYVLSAARLFAGSHIGSFAVPEAMVSSGLLAPTGVDAFAMAQLCFPGGSTAQIACAVGRDLGERIEVFCNHGSLTLHDPWLPGKDRGPSNAKITVRQDGRVIDHVISAPLMLYAYEAENASRAIRAGQRELAWPHLSSSASISMAEQLDEWRRQVLH